MKNLLFIFAFFLFFLTLPIFILSFFPVTKTIYHLSNTKQNQSHELSQISEDLLGQTIDYLNNSVAVYELKLPPNIDLTLSLAESSHMKDVKSLFQTTRKIFVLSTIVLLSIFLTAKTEDKTQLLSHFNKSIQFLIPALILLSLGIFLAWDDVFTLFHQIFFSQGNWAFSEKSLIIQLFPDSFWWGMAMGYEGMVGMELATTLIIFSKKAN